MRDDVLKKVEGVIEKYIDVVRYGIFDCRNTVGDAMTTVYEERDIQVDICYEWEYFEIFGLTPEEFEKVAHYYYTLLANRED